MAQSQMLYATLISVCPGRSLSVMIFQYAEASQNARRQGLLAVNEVNIDGLLPVTMNLTQRWQAWARIESTKR